MNKPPSKKFLPEKIGPLLVFGVACFVIGMLAVRSSPPKPLPPTPTPVAVVVAPEKNFVPKNDADLHALGIVYSTLLALQPQPKITAEKIPAPAHKPGEALPRTGDEIVVCGQLFHTGAPVVLWTDPGGYDAYRTEARFLPYDNADWEKASKILKELKSPNRYGLRKDLLSPAEIERVRGGGWDLDLLQSKVDQFVLHYDVAGISRNCFRTLHDARCLSVHFMLDIDGTLYQTLDLKERAWHATTSNSRSIGIEIASIGAYPDLAKSPLPHWYQKNKAGKLIIIPQVKGETGIRTPNFTGSPMRPDPIEGNVQGTKLTMYDLTPQQYDTLIKLTATLCNVFPKITCDYPRDEKGALIRKVLPDDQLKNYHGIMGHYHIQQNKIDPGPALQWDYLIDNARKYLDQKKSEPKKSTLTELEF